MPFFVTPAGAVVELDPPTGGFQREWHDEKVARGELVELPADAVVRRERLNSVDARTGAPVFEHYWELADGYTAPARPLEDPVELLVEADPDTPADESPYAGASKAELIERAAELGVEVSPRWGAARIAQALEGKA